MTEPMELCPICGRPLRNGVDSKQYVDFEDDYEKQYFAGLIDFEELKRHVIVYYDRPRLCFNSGNGASYTDENGKISWPNPPCSNYFAIRGGTIDSPDVVVETIKIRDN